ncbi:hypothetical protein L6164_019676 [Bauhinia variegata]|uniref:Uncharacterized protein n=1 Tax=Bauhinia variegata TaxID=167791 RepID=A0ACB9MUJ5_BAUVA|nr:hypothetical protein L6164_019676 [Bauhinia variegata]
MGFVENMLHSESLRMVTLVNNNHSAGRSTDSAMEDGDCTFRAQSISKRRKVSANRDFPDGCGRFAKKIDLKPKVDTASFNFGKSAVVEDNGEGTSKGEVESQHYEFSETKIPTETHGQADDFCLTKDSPVVSSIPVDGPPLTNNKPEEVQLEDLDALVDKLTRTAEGVCCDSSNVSKFLSQDVNLSCSSGCLDKALNRSYLPRRRVSANRDFPPLCGRNAPRLEKDESPTINLSVENKCTGRQNLAVDEKPLRNVAAASINEMEKNVLDGDACEGRQVDIARVDSEGNNTEEVKGQDVCESSPQMKLPLENEREKCVTISNESNNHRVELNSKAVIKEEKRDMVQFEGNSGKEIIVYPGVQGLVTKSSDVSGHRRWLKRDPNELQVASERVTVLALMSESECPWRRGRGSSKYDLIGGTNESKEKKVKHFQRLDKSKSAIKTENLPSHSRKKPLKKQKGSTSCETTGQMVFYENTDGLDPNGNIEEFRVVPRRHDFTVNLPPFGHGSLSGHACDSTVTRNKVRETLRLFQALCRKFLQEDEAKLGSVPGDNSRRRVDLLAAKILKDKNKYVNTGKQILGSVPGVEVGDEFQYRVELNIIGLHRLTQGGIDYVKHNGKVLATSVVASGGYADDLDNSDVLVYTGSGGNVMNSGKEPEDQKLQRGNLALKNSCEERNPVRVIRGSDSKDGKSKKYVYDGLYVVDRYWQEMGPHGKLVFKFQLHRIPDQPELAWKEVKNSTKFKIREGLCVDDISLGKERMKIFSVNTIDDEKPPPFHYSTSMIYPDWCNPIPPEGCNCTNGCSDSEKCSCAVKNGGEIPFNHNGAIVEAKPLVYECGPSCRCPSTCHNRVSQHGIKFQLEIFKTKTRGWGVRSLNSIPSGSFICEYIGELLEEKEAEQRTGNDEYLFDIGNNYSNSTLWDGLSILMSDLQASSCEVVGDGGFTIDAAQFGNVGRFINHSCSPNLYAQNVLYDHDDKRIPHIMLFAAENIPPLQELTYDYNYIMDQVRDSDGNIKKKDCYCGSAECTGRMY